MPDAPVKSAQQGPKLMIRKGKKVTEGVPVPSVFADIKAGKLKPSYEFSMDGENWRRLDQHPQLARLFAQVKQQDTQPRKSRKGLVFFLFLILALAGAGAYFHPYWAFFNVQTAGEYNNKTRLEQWIQKPALAQGITSQVNVIWQGIAASKIKGTSNDRAVKADARSKVDLLLKEMFTTDAVIAYTKGQVDLTIPDKEDAKDPKVARPVNDPFAQLGVDMDSANKVIDKIQVVLAKADLTYVDMNTVTASVKATGNRNIIFKYQRQGMDWKLVDIQLPPDSIRTAIDGIVQTALDQAAAKAKKQKRRKEKVKSKSPQVAKALTAESSYMKMHLALKNLAVGKGKKYQFGSPNPGIFATLVNKGNKTLNEVEVTVYFFNSKNVIVSDKKLYPVSTRKWRPGRDNDPLNPNSDKRIGYLVKDFAPKSWAGKIVLKVTNIKFKDA